VLVLVLVLLWCPMTERGPELVACGVAVVPCTLRRRCDGLVGLRGRGGRDTVTGGGSEEVQSPGGGRRRYSPQGGGGGARGTAG